MQHHLRICAAMPSPPVQLAGALGTVSFAVLAEKVHYHSRCRKKCLWVPLSLILLPLAQSLCNHLGTCTRLDTGPAVHCTGLPPS